MNEENRSHNLTPLQHLIGGEIPIAQLGQAQTVVRKMCSMTCLLLPLMALRPVNFEPRSDQHVHGRAGRTRTESKGSVKNALLKWNLHLSPPRFGIDLNLHTGEP